MSLVQMNCQALEPTRVIHADQKNIAAPALDQQIYPVTTGNFGVGCSNPLSEMRFSFGSPNCAWVPSKTLLEFDVAVGATGCLARAEDLFSRCRIQTQSGVILVDDAFHNLFSSIQQVAVIGNETKAHNWESGMDAFCQSDANLATYGGLTATAVHYCLRPSVMFLDQIQSLCLPLSGNIQIIFTMETDSVALPLYSAATPYYIVTNPVLVVHLLPYQPDYLNKLLAIGAAGGYVLNYSSVYHQQAAAAGTNNTITVNYAMKSIRGAVAVFRISTELTTRNYNKLQKFQIPGTAFTAPNVIYYQYQIGSQMFPSSPVQTYTRAWVETKKLMNTFLDVDAGSQVTRARWSAANVTGADQGSTGPLFIAAASLARAGINTGESSVSGPLQLQINNAGATANLVCDLFCIYDCLLVVQSPSLSICDN